VLGAGVTSAPFISPATSGSFKLTFILVARTISENLSGAGEAVLKNTSIITETALTNSAPFNDLNPLVFILSNVSLAVRPFIIMITIILIITVI